MEEGLRYLVDEMGFPNPEARMALEDCSNDITKAIERLLAGEYKPPPYSDFAEPVVPTTCSSRSILCKFREEMTSLDKEMLYPALPSNPPPYSKVPIDSTMKAWENECSASFFSCSEVVLETEDVRCSTCFDPVREEKGLDRAVKDGFRVYHYECYTKSRGPKCSHCCFSLAKPDQDRELSGQYLVYQGKNYHVECYEKYAGPRCSLCFNVIIERPNEAFTGRWMQKGSKIYHEECYYQKQYSDYRAKTS